MILFLLAVGLAALSGVPGLFGRDREGRTAAMLMTASAVLGTWAGVRVLLGAPAPALRLPTLALGSQGLLVLDPIAAWFLLPVLLLSACGAWYGVAYWHSPQGSPRWVRLVFGLLTAALAVLVCAAHMWVFLLAWEGMAIAAYAVGADQGFVYVRAEYPLAISRLNIAIKQAKALYAYTLKHGYGRDLTKQYMANLKALGASYTRRHRHHTYRRRLQGRADPEGAAGHR